MDADPSLQTDGVSAPSGPPAAVPGSAVAPDPAAAPAAPVSPAAPVTDPGGTPVSRRRPRNTRALRLVLEWVLVLLVAVGVAALVRTYVLQTYYIPSASMVPTLQVGDRILVDKLSYHMHAIHRGDIVVFRRPPSETADLVPDLVKRVVGLPGETISGHGGNVYVDGRLLAEPWLPAIDQKTTGTFGPIRVPRGDYFMMGDNRPVSYDSRAWGPLPRSYIVGRVVMRIWPVSRITTF